MSHLDCFRLFAVCLWLLDGGVNSENAQKGYILRVQAGRIPIGVHSSDNEGQMEPPFFRIPTSGYKTSSVDRKQSGIDSPSQEDHSISSQSRDPYQVILEAQNVPKSQVNHFKSGLNLASHAAGRGAVQVPPRRYHPRTKLTGAFSPVQVDKGTVGSSQNNRKALIKTQSSTASQHILDIKTDMNPSIPKVYPLISQESRLATGPEVSGYHPAYGFPNSFSHHSARSLPKGLKPTEKTDAIMTGTSPGRKSAGKVATHMSYPLWSPRGFSSDVFEARGYAHVRHLKPGFDKIWHQAGSVPPTSSERPLNLNHHGSVKQPGIWHPPQPYRAQTSVQGKFKPFQRVSSNELPALNHLDGKTAPTPTSNQTILPPGLNSTDIALSVVPSVAGELSTESALPTTTEGRDEPQASTHDGQSESSGATGPFFEQNEPPTVSPPEPQPAEVER